MLQSTKSYIIACDLDDTITHFLLAWVKWLNDKHSCYVKYSDITDWQMELAYPQLTEFEIFEPLFNDEFWKTVQPRQDAIHYIEKLINEGFQFYIVTSTNYRTAVSKFDNVLFKYFPFIDRHQIITTYNKQLIRCDILVDDGAHNIVGPYIGLLMDAPHNQKFNDNEFENVYRVHCWKEIYEKIHTIVDNN